MWGSAWSKGRRPLRAGEGLVVWSTARGFAPAPTVIPEVDLEAGSVREECKARTIPQTFRLWTKGDVRRPSRSHYSESWTCRQKRVILDCNDHGEDISCAIDRRCDSNPEASNSLWDQCPEYSAWAVRRCCERYEELVRFSRTAVSPLELNMVKDDGFATEEAR
eukprot:4704007-Amphidinium_carterae.1